MRFIFSLLQSIYFHPINPHFDWTEEYIVPLPCYCSEYSKVYGWGEQRMRGEWSDKMSVEDERGVDEGQGEESI